MITDQDSVNPPKRKRPTAERRSEGLDDDLLTAVARLSLGNAATLRNLKGAIIRTVLAPADSWLLLAGKSASQEWSRQYQGSSTSHREPSYLTVFAAMANALRDKLVENRAMSSADLLPFSLIKDTTVLLECVQACRISRTYDKDHLRLELAVSGQLKPIGDLIVKALIEQGARECFGAAPRGPLERSIAGLLGKHFSA